MRFLTEFRDQETQDARSVLTSDFVVDLEKGYRGYHEFASLQEGVFAVLDDDELTIKKGFSSNLCSPAFRFFRRWVGTYSGPKEAPASVIHDCARRVRRLPCSPFNRKDTDDFFWDALKLKGSSLTRPYHFAVSSPIGSVFIRLTESSSLDCYCVRHHK